MALLAASITAFPALPIAVTLLLSGLAGPGLMFSVWISLMLFGMFFVPALLGILLLQMPLKAFLEKRGIVGSRVTLSVMGANIALVFALFLGFGAEFSAVGIALVLPFTIFASGLWLTLDDRALHGPHTYIQERI